ncbi:hypothetical protein ACFV4N_02955 [Actinosynnema sp. NPDC059797]
MRVGGDVRRDAEQDAPVAQPVRIQRRADDHPLHLDPGQHRAEPPSEHVADAALTLEPEFLPPP